MARMKKKEKGRSDGDGDPIKRSGEVKREGRGSEGSMIGSRRNKKKKGGRMARMK